MRLRFKQVFASHLVAAIIFLMMAESASAQGSLAGARELYTAAAYDDALAMLNGLRGADRRPEEGRTIDQYRALCLLALGRADEAAGAIQAMVVAAPSYHLSDTEASPRVRTAFHDVRQRMLPAIIQQKYADARAAFDRKNLAAASDGFKLVLELLNDPDLGSAGNQPPLSQLRPMAINFRDLAAASASTSSPAAARPSTPTPPATAARAPVRPAAPRIYSFADANVIPPTTLRQTMPVLGEVFVQRQGAVEIIIDETGLVESATMAVPVNVVYNGLVLAAAKNWRYMPATVDGVAVKFRNTIQLDLKRH
jgi:hypothetical protein